jgi:4-amino-4-deoxy-L-arabinose transferase-like glycosyltransferase
MYKRPWIGQRHYQALLALLAVGLFLRLIIGLWLHPGFDEAYYYLYTLYPSLSYFDHPPLVALTTGLGPWLTGLVSQFTIRLGSVLLYTGSLVFLYFTGRQLFSRQAALAAVAIATIAPIFLVGFGTLTLPDSPLIFFWSASLYCAAQEFFKGKGKDDYRPSYRLAILGLLVGLACLGKYHGFILGLGLVGFCLTSVRHRRAFSSPWTWLGLGLFVLALSPLLLWNWQHDWVSFRFQSARAVPGTGYRFENLLLTFLAGIAYLFPPIGLGLWWVCARALAGQVQQFRLQDGQIDPRRAERSRRHRFLLWASLPLILGFTLISGYQQVLPTWPMPGFWGATLLLGDQISRWQEKNVLRINRWLWGSGLVSTTILLIALAHVSAGIFQRPSTHALIAAWPAQADSSTQLIDVQQLRQGFQQPPFQAALQSADFVFTNQHFLGGQIAMAIAPLGKSSLACFDGDPRGFAFWFDAQQWLGRNALYITSELFQPGDEAAVQRRYDPYFQSFRKLGEIPIRRGGVVVQRFTVYQAQALLKPYPLPYGS